MVGLGGEDGYTGYSQGREVRRGLRNAEDETPSAAHWKVDAAAGRCFLREIAKGTHVIGRFGTLAALFFVLLGLALACGEDGERDTSPTPSVTGPTPNGDELRLLYREFGQIADIVWLVDPENPGGAERLATIGHAPTWGTFIALSPAGDAIAYTLLPETARDQKGEAQAWVRVLRGGQPSLVAENVDLLAPLWSPDGKYVYLRRNGDDSIGVIQVELSSGEERLVLRRPTSEAGDLLLVGFAGDGSTLYYVEVEIGAAGQVSVSLGGLNVASGEASIVMPLSDRVARDFALSPDGRRLAFFSQELVEGRLVLRSYLADIESRTVGPLSASVGEVQLHPVWHPQGDVVTVGLGPGEQLGGVANVPLNGGAPTYLTAPETGFDIPITWSPGGQYLAVRSFRGDSLGNPGPAFLVLISSDGQRIVVSEETDVEPIGWTLG